MMDYESEVFFTLRGSDFDPDHVTRLVGLEPTSIKRQATPFPVHSSWSFSLGKIKTDFVDLYEHSERLVARLLPYAEKIAAAKSELDLFAVFQIVLWIPSDSSKPTPAIGFAPEVVSFLGAVGASIDIDTYRE